MGALHGKVHTFVEAHRSRVARSALRDESRCDASHAFPSPDVYRRLILRFLLPVSILTGSQNTGHTFVNILLSIPSGTVPPAV